MQTGDIIRFLRTGNNKCGKKWTQAELGAALKPPVNRAAVSKWETGDIKAIKKSYIEQLAILFDVSPMDLLCFESEFDENKISEEVIAIEHVQRMFGESAVRLLHYFHALNDLGKNKALENISDLSEVSKYTGSK